MITDTPRTDKVAPDFRPGSYDRLYSLCGQIERELARANDNLAFAAGQVEAADAMLDIIRADREKLRIDLAAARKALGEARDCLCLDMEDGRGCVRCRFIRAQAKVLAIRDGKEDQS